MVYYYRPDVACVRILSDKIMGTTVRGNWFNDRYLRSWGKESGRRRQTRPRRERVREKENLSHTREEYRHVLYLMGFLVDNGVFGERILKLVSRLFGASHANADPLSFR